MAKRKFDREVEKTICDRYILGETTITLGKVYDCGWGVIHNILKREKIKCRNRTACITRNKINEGYFENIDSEIKAYFLGLLYADGGIVKNTCTLQLLEKDGYLVQKFNDAIQTKETKLVLTRLGEGRYIKAVISNKKIIDSLEKFGVVERKTEKIEFPPPIEEGFILPFIRGYFDGDGCVYISLSENKNKRRGTVSMVSNPRIFRKLKELFV